MNAEEFLKIRTDRARKFGFPDPIVINAERISNRTRVIYLVEIQATHILDDHTKKTHHFALKFCKFRKINTTPYWEEENILTRDGFTIKDNASIEKLAGYIKANQALLDIDVLSNDYTEAVLTNDATKASVLKEILSQSESNTQLLEVLKEHYPDLDKKILTYKLVQQRKKNLEEFKKSLDDSSKKERNYWQPFLENNRWMFGLSYFVLLDENRIDLWDTADYLFESEDGFIDIVEIKHPHVSFWQKDTAGNYDNYRGFLQPSEELKGAITQATNYIFQVEKKFSDPDWHRKNKCEAPVKPSCTVIFGRSHDWTIEEKTAFRLLNDSLHGITVITFDHLLARATLLLDSLEKEE